MSLRVIYEPRYNQRNRQTTGDTTKTVDSGAEMVA